MVPRIAVLPTFVALAALASTLFTSSVASADDVRFGVSYFGYGGTESFSHAELSSLTSETPDVLRNRNVWLDGSARNVGAGARGVLDIDGVRIGLGEAFYGIDGATLGHDAIPNGFTVTASEAWGAHGELSIGKRFGVHGIYPYVDLRTAITLESVKVGLQSQAIGFTGKTSYQAIDFALGPRVGAMIPLGSVFFLDGSAQYSFIGPEQLAFCAGIGMWYAGDPLP